MLPPAKLSTTGKPLQAGREVFSSLALGNLLEPLRNEGKHHVLDLGPACGQNVTFFCGMRCKLYVADLYDALNREPVSSGRRSHERSSLFQRQLVIDREDHFDVIMAWDVLNYLKSNVLLEVFKQLRPFCGQGTLLHALIWGQSEIPAVPMRFSVTDERHMAYDVCASSMRSGPRYTPREMERLMAGFRVSRSYLLRNGMQEYVFSLDEALSPG